MTDMGSKALKPGAVTDCSMSKLTWHLLQVTLCVQHNALYSKAAWDKFSAELAAGILLSAEHPPSSALRNIACCVHTAMVVLLISSRIVACYQYAGNFEHVQLGLYPSACCCW